MITKRVTPSIFYSWQSDWPENTNRYFIRDALKICLKGMTIEEPLRLESDTTGAAGTPDIAATIFERISGCEVAVFDVTPVSRLAKTRKALPNPNVMIELGYAARAIGWERIVCVMNLARKHRPEELPFDLRARRFPILYSYSEGDSAKKDISVAFATALDHALTTALSNLHNGVQRTFNRMNAGCLAVLEKCGKSNFFSAQLQQHPVIDRLLELGVLRCDSDPEKNKYAYHWTHLGKRVNEVYWAKKSGGACTTTPSTSSP